MVRLEEIIDKISAYNTAADLELIKKAYIFSARSIRGRCVYQGSLISAIFLRWQTP